MTGMRTYGDGCSSGHALDVIGERWALLIVRDLLLGPKRFSDLHAGLPQSSPNVLTQRLRELESAGVVRRRKLPPPASTMVYELTPWGAGLEPIVLGLQRWGAASPNFAPDAPVGCDAAMLALKNGFHPGSPVEGPGVMDIEIRFDGATFAVTVDAAGLDIRRGSASDPQAVIGTDPETLEQVAFGMLARRDAEGTGALRIEGDHAVAERFLTLFPTSSAVTGER